MLSPIVANGSDLSVVWANVFMELMQSPGGARHPGLVVIECDSRGPMETPAIRSRLDTELKANRLNSCSTVAGTIFPASMWNPDLANDADVLFERYHKAWPAIKK